MENDVAEGRIEAQIDFVFDLHLLVQELIDRKGVSRSELAKRMGISKARLSQLMRPEANPTARSIADIFFALGEELSLSLKPSQRRTTDTPGEREASTRARRNDVLHALFLPSPVVRPIEFEAVNENYPDYDFELAA